MIKRHALGSSIYEEGDTLLPFNHTIDDVKIQKVYEIKCLQKVVLADIIGDIDGLGIEFGKEDFIDANDKNKEANQIINDDKYLKEYLDAKGGRLKCLPLGYMQGNFAYYYSQRNEFIDSCINDLKQISKNHAKTLDYSSGEDEEFKDVV